MLSLNSGGWETEDQVAGSLVSWEGSLPALERVVFLLHAPMAVRKHDEARLSSSSSFSLLPLPLFLLLLLHIRALIPS